MTVLRLATRRSALALAQSRQVARILQDMVSGLQVEEVQVVTQGDRVLDRALSEVGGKGLFVREIEEALLDGRADLAVHSMKDVPVNLPPGFSLAAMLVREDPLDAFVSGTYADVESLPPGARVGTSSLRRESQLRARRPDLVVSPVRGNVQTRLRKLDEGEFDAILLAAAGLKRLGLTDRIRSIIGAEESLPAVGQGALGIEIRADRDDVAALLAPLVDADTTWCVRAERAMSRALSGSCTVPLGGHARISAGVATLHGLVATQDGARIARASAQAGTGTTPEALGQSVADQLIAAGALEILAAAESMA